MVAKIFSFSIFDELFQQYITSKQIIQAGFIVTNNYAFKLLRCFFGHIVAERSKNLF